jgi:DNA modification methylase
MSMKAIAATRLLQPQLGDAGGSGATLIAAERTGRICRGLELDPLYVDTAVRRWQGIVTVSG